MGQRKREWYYLAMIITSVTITIYLINLCMVIYHIWTVLTVGNLESVPSNQIWYRVHRKEIFNVNTGQVLLFFLMSYY